MLTYSEDYTNKQINLGEMPLGDLFRFVSMTPEHYELFSKNYLNPILMCINLLIEQTNTFYSSEYLKKLDEMLQAKL